MTVAIIIPARYGSTRFPGKPLQMLGNKTVLTHVVACAREAATDARIAVATDDERIAQHARENGVEVFMTSPDCQTGTDRVYEASRQMSPRPNIVLNLQGDAPFTPVAAIKGVIDLLQQKHVQVATPAVRMSWPELDTLREHKKTTPHSGTTVVVDNDNRAMWFSKTILPSLRDETTLRAEGDISPVLRHIGLYGYRAEALESFVNWPEGRYEALEKLEQLRMLENGLSIHCAILDHADEWALGGIDTPEDLKRANAYVKDRNS